MIQNHIQVHSFLNSNVTSFLPELGDISCQVHAIGQEVLTQLLKMLKWLFMVYLTMIIYTKAINPYFRELIMVGTPIQSPCLFVLPRHLPGSLTPSCQRGGEAFQRERVRFQGRSEVRRTEKQPCDLLNEDIKLAQVIREANQLVKGPDLYKEKVVIIFWNKQLTFRSGMWNFQFVDS